MVKLDEVCADHIEAKELTPEQARIKREEFLALAEKNAELGEGASDDVDSADSTMATLILPGG
jgi:hypothetical protein